MLNITVPVTERFSDDSFNQTNHIIAKQIRERNAIAESAKEYFSARHENNNTAMKDEYYSAIAALLAHEDYERVLFYFPLSDLRNAPSSFKSVYIRAWYNLLNYYDARENFFEGDVFELDARPGGQVEQVVKCAHLTPWLLSAGYIEYSDIERILNLGKDDTVLLQSFAETWRFLENKKLLTDEQLKSLRMLTPNLPSRKRLKPLYVSEKRKKWLITKEQDPSPLITPNANLAGPFSQNLEILQDGLERIQSSLEPDEIVLVTGSRLKGYGTQNSDWDIFRLENLENAETMRPGSPRAAALYFNAIWLGGDNVQNLDEIAVSKVSEYFGRSDRKMSIERLEQDLLQYRLLHKGYKLFHPEYRSVAEFYPEIDGNCPFYNDEYRRIATELYAKYVFIPQEI